MNQIARTVSAHTITATVNIELVPREHGYDLRIVSRELAFDGSMELDGETSIHIMGPQINLSGTRQLHIENCVDLPARLFF